MTQDKIVCQKNTKIRKNLKIKMGVEVRDAFRENDLSPRYVSASGGLNEGK